MPDTSKKTLPKRFPLPRLSIVASALLAMSPLVSAQISYLPAGHAPYNVSGNGQVIVGEMPGGYSGELAFRWTPATGSVSLGMLDAGLPGQYGFSEATAASYDGSVVVGSSSQVLNGQPNGRRAFRWTASGGMQSLGLLAGGVFSKAHGISDDGTVIVGASVSFNGGYGFEAFRWTAGTGMVGLGAMVPSGSSYNSEAFAVSGNGQVIVGAATSPNGMEAFRWTQGGGMVGLGALAAGAGNMFYSEAWAVNHDGSAIVGQSLNNQGNDEAFRWTQAGGMVGLGDLPGGNFSSGALAVTADGQAVVGFGATGQGQEAFRWTQASGMQRLVDWLAGNGVNVASNYVLNNASGISADGSVVVGRATIGGHEEGYIARVSPIGSGAITLSALQQSLSAAQVGGMTALRSGSMLLGGAHSRPLIRRVSANQKAFWVAGDWGRDDHGDRDGDLGLAEIGGGLHLGPTQLNVAIGHVWAHQKQELDSQTSLESNFLQADWLIPLSGNVWGVLSAYGMWGEADMRRGYLNAGLPDRSKGNSDIDSWGVRARVEWENAATLAKIAFAPYADLAYGEARVKDYTETGGGFPIRFDSRTEKSTELRLGLNATRPIAEKLNIVGLVEAGHRFEKHGARMKGQILGLFGFDEAGDRLDRDWMRVGFGIEGKVGSGWGSVMLNTTTQGEVPNAWLAASWQLAF